MKKLLKRIKLVIKLILNFFYQPIWGIIGLQKRNSKLWIFTSWSGKKYNDNSRIFYEYVVSNAADIKCVWILKDQKLINSLNEKGINAIHASTWEARKVILAAGKLFTVRDDEFSFRMINGIEWYQLWHGMPLKKIKEDYTDGIKVFSKRAVKYKSLRDKLEPWRAHVYKKRFTVTNSDFFTPFLQTSFKLPETRVLKTGTPRCDALFYRKPDELILKIRNKYKGCKIILYMPTFRNSQWGGALFNPFITDYCFDSNRFEKVLEEKNLVFVFKPHFYDSSIVDGDERLKSRIVKITDDDFDELYNFAGQTDVLMTDYSSIYFDYLITKKPVILAPFDYAEYLHKSREHYFDYFDQMDGVKAKNWDEVIDILENDRYKSVSDDKVRQFAEYADGQSCKKLFDYLMENLYE